MISWKVILWRAERISNWEMSSWEQGTAEASKSTKDRAIIACHWWMVLMNALAALAPTWLSELILRYCNKTFKSCQDSCRLRHTSYTHFLCTLHFFNTLMYLECTVEAWDKSHQKEVQLKYHNGGKKALRQSQLGSLWWIKKCNPVGCQKRGCGHGGDGTVSKLKSPPLWVQKTSPPKRERGLGKPSLFLTLFPIPLWPADSWQSSHTSFPLCRSPQLQLQLDLQSSELLWDLAVAGKVLAKKKVMLCYYHHQHAERCSCFPFVFWNCFYVSRTGSRGKSCTIAFGRACARKGTMWWTWPMGRTSITRHQIMSSWWM